MHFTEPPITILLIVLNAIFSFIGFSNETLVNKTVMWPYYIKREKQYYRFITSGFLHADWIHLIFNMFTLYFFGGNIERYFAAYGLGGNISYLILYIAGMVVADIPTYFRHQDDRGYRSLGASGAVSAAVFASIVFDPWGKILLFGAIGISSTVYAILFIIYCVKMDKKGADNINHNAHLWGALFGLVFTIALIAALQPVLFNGILEQLKHPSLFGR
ncbi:MAG: rhomboid family intramembrane serine protease [Ferruginibacter sp.]